MVYNISIFPVTKPFRETIATSKNQYLRSTHKKTLNLTLKDGIPCKEIRRRTRITYALNKGLKSPQKLRLACQITNIIQADINNSKDEGKVGLDGPSTFSETVRHQLMVTKV